MAGERSVRAAVEARRELEDEEAAAAAYDAYESALARRELEDINEAAVAAYDAYESGRSELAELPGRRTTGQAMRTTRAARAA